MSMRRMLFLAPLVVFVLLGAVFFYRLAMIEQGERPDLLPSTLINKPAPAFSLAPLIEGQAGLSRADLAQGNISLVNVFASWCGPCRIEHPILVKLAETGKIRLIGINYKDKRDAALAWLDDLGNPYHLIGADSDGRAAIEWGVYGVPESYIVDGAGIIRYKHVGPISQRDVDEKILPIIEKLSAQR